MIQAVIFDLDGVIVSTDDFHYEAWKDLADSLEIPFDRTENERLRGVSRRESLEIILEKATKVYEEDAIESFLQLKNERYKEKLVALSRDDLLEGVSESLTYLKEQGIKIAIGSSSKNAPQILEQIGMSDYFDTVVDGNQIAKSKPDPEVFLLAAKHLGVAPEACLVVEDAEAGVMAALAGGMKVLAVGAANTNKEATYKSQTLSVALLKTILF